MKHFFKTQFLFPVVFFIFYTFSSCVIEPRPMKITYKTEYGTTPDEKKVPVNSILTEKELPTLYSEDYTFEGWYDGDIKAEPGEYVITKHAGQTHYRFCKA